MMISTRGRYALRVLADLAINASERLVPLREVAARQQIPLKYLERIMGQLADAGFVASVSGRAGGYRLAKPARDFTAGDVLRLTEGTLAPVACLCPGSEPCCRALHCPTLPMWKEFAAQANRFFDGISIHDLASGNYRGLANAPVSKPE